MCRKMGLKIFSFPKPPHQLAQGTALIKTSCHLCSLKTNIIYFPKKKIYISQRSNVCLCQQYAMETERIQCQLRTQNKARSLHQWFSALRIAYRTAAETPANLRLDYMQDSKIRGLSGNRSGTYILITPVSEHETQHIFVVKPSCSCLQHRWVPTTFCYRNCLFFSF